MTAADRRARFRGLLAGEGCLAPASVYDPLSARIAADLGYDCAMLAGSVAAHVVLGAPDRMLLSLTEFADLARRITRAGAPPLLVDADHGYGNALGVMRAVAELEAAGVAALTIEDTALPAPYAVAGPSLIPLAEGVGKMRAAVAARTDPSLVIVARTGACAITGPEDAALRLAAYADCGVDAVFVVGLKTRAALQAITAAVRLPIVLGGVEGELADRAFLAAQGVRIALAGHAPLLAAVAATEAALRAQAEGTPPPPRADAATMRRLLRDDDWTTASREFLAIPD